MFGEELIWLFIFGDLATFSMFFFVFGYGRNQELELFRASQETLSVHYGSINTIMLLASSWLVVLAARALRSEKLNWARNHLIAASLLGTVFAILKVLEYREKFAEGYDFTANNFWLFYYLLTGLHLAHLLTGIAILLYFALVFGRGRINDGQRTTFESGAIFWHMVDLLWIIIFPLLYLLP